MSSHSFVSRERRTPNSTKIGINPFRKTTPRPSIDSGSFLSGSQIAFDDDLPETPKKENLLNTVIAPPKAPDYKEISGEVSKSMKYFDLVKQTASFVIRSVALKDNSLKDPMMRVYEDFFSSFNLWISSIGRLSQRKVTNLTVSSKDLTDLLRNAQAQIKPLQSEYYRWTKIDSFVPPIIDSGENDPINGYIHSPDLFKLNEIIESLDKLSLSIQNQKRKGILLSQLCSRINNSLIHELECDFDKQMKISKFLK